MKNTKLLRILATCVILSLVLILLPASPALAARTVEIDPEEGRIGDDIDVDGAGFPPDNPDTIPPFESYVDVYFTSVTTAGAAPAVGRDIGTDVKTYNLVDEKADCGTGDFSTSFEIPDRLSHGSEDEDVRGGTYYVCVTYWDEADIKAVATFAITAGEITDFDPDSGPVGIEVSISGDNFAEREDLTIEFDGDELDIEGDTDTDSGGAFDCSIIIPESVAGDHTITISDETLTEVEETFEVESAMDFTPKQAPPGDTVTVSGTGYGDEVLVDIFLDTMSVASGEDETGGDGSFTIEFTVPDIEEGTYDLVAEDDDGNIDEGSFIVEVGIEVAISPVTSASSPGHVDESVTINGVGFLANATITIIYASTPTTVATTTSDANGDFTATFNIPKSEAGAHTITASDGTNSLEVPFYMESQAPPVPEPIMPETGVKAKAMTEFAWEDVEDDSGVTYELQVATSDDFATASRVLEVTGLTSSEYTLSKEEALASRSEEEPYYWRVRAVDGAGNEGNWSDAGDFSVGFAWPTWIIHLWWGLGVIGAIFFGYYLGKRRAYYY